MDDHWNILQFISDMDDYVRAHPKIWDNKQFKREYMSITSGYLSGTNRERMLYLIEYLGSKFNPNIELVEFDRAISNAYIHYI